MPSANIHPTSLIGLCETAGSFARQEFGRLSKVLVDCMGRGHTAENNHELTRGQQFLRRGSFSESRYERTYGGKIDVTPSPSQLKSRNDDATHSSFLIPLKIRIWYE